MNHFENMGLAELSTHFRDGRLDPVAVARWCSERHAEFGATLGAYKTWNGEELLSQANLATQVFRAGRDVGPMQGIPFSAKDLFGVPGFPTFAGSPNALPVAWERPGPVVNQLLRQLAPVSGKTHTVEFAFGGLGTNPHWGAPRNPWSTSGHRVPGGSSSGAGVSLIEGSALLALGTDTAGSVRIPASMTGTVGLKTSHGRWSLDGIVPLSTSFDTPGVLSRTVADAVWAFEAIDPEPVARIQGVYGLRIGVPAQFFWDDCDPGVPERVEEAVLELEKAGARVVPLEIADVQEAYGYFKLGGLAPPELYAFLERDLPDWLESLDPNVRKRLDAGIAFPAWEYLQRRDRFQAIGRGAAARLEIVDVMLAPSVAVTPPTLDALVPEGEYARLNMRALRNTSIANVLGLCSLTMPIGLDSAGMPAGLLLMAPASADPRLLGCALAMEGVLGTGLQRMGRAPLLGRV